MLLSMFTSFLLARRFGGKAYVALLIVFSILVALFSVGIPRVDAYWRYTYRKYSVELKYLLPLSFPFYASVFVALPLRTHTLPTGWEFVPNPPRHYYQLHFVTLKIQELGLPIGLVHFILFYSLFLVINIAGAILGYLISKTTFIEKLHTRRKPT